MSYHICEVDGVHLKKNSMSNHKKSVHVTSRLFNCDQCSQKFKNKRDVPTHVSKVHVEVQFLCAECQKLFKTEQQLKTHKQSVHGKKKFFCAVCGKGVSSIQKQKAHYKYCKDKHVKAEKVELKRKFTDVIIEQSESYHECFTEFVSAGEESFFPCTICDKIFSSSNKLKIHKYQYHCSEEDRKCKF